MARKKERAQKRPRTARQHSSRQTQKPKQQQLKRKSPGNHKRSQWLKDARARLSKPTTSSDFDQKSKAAALQQTKENESEQQKILYSSSADNRSFTTINKSELKFSPTVKKLNVGSDSPWTPPYEFVTSSNPNDFMNDNNEPTQCAQEPSQPSCSYSTPIEAEPKGIIKSTPRMDRIVNKIWKQPNHEDVTTLDDSSTSPCNHQSNRSRWCT